MRQRLLMWAPGPRSVAVAGALVALAAWSFWQRWQLLAASPFPLGVDGYFYPVQLRSLLDHGVLRYPASPLAFYLLAPLAAITDPITGVKLGAALFGAAIAAPMYGVGTRLGGSRGAGLVAAALATTSVGSTYLTIEFVKNGIGLTLAVTALWLALRATDRPTRPRLTAAIVALLAAYATHKMAAAIVLVVAIPAALAAATSRGVLRGRRLLITIAGLVLLGGVALAIGAAFPQRFLSARDASLVRGLVSTTPRWTAPALVFPTGELTLGHDALLGLVLALVAVVVRLGAKRAHRPRGSLTSPPEPAAPTAAAPTAAAPTAAAPTAAAPTAAAPTAAAPTAAAPTAAAPTAAASAAAASAALTPTAAAMAAAWPILALAIVIGLPFLGVTDRQGLGFRLRIAAFVPAALAAAIAARALLAHVARRDWLLVPLALVLAVVREPGTRLDGAIVTHPALVAAAQALNGQIPPGATVIVPERHIAFMVAWYTGATIALRPDRVPPERRVRLLPLRSIGADSPLDRQLIAARAEPSLIPPLGVHPGHPNGLVLVAEPTWEWILEKLPPADRARFAAWPTI